MRAIDLYSGNWPLASYQPPGRTSSTPQALRLAVHRCTANAMRCCSTNIAASFPPCRKVHTGRCAQCATASCLRRRAFHCGQRPVEPRPRHHRRVSASCVRRSFCVIPERQDGSLRKGRSDMSRDAMSLPPACSSRIKAVSAKPWTDN